MLLYQGAFTPWLAPQTRKKILELRDRILQDDDVHGLWQDILVSSFILFFSGAQNTAIGILEGFFTLCPLERDQNGSLVWTNAPQLRIVQEQKALEVLMHYAPRRPANFPYVMLTDEKLHDPAFDIAKPEFYHSRPIPWIHTEWIYNGTDYGKQAGATEITESYDPHLWKQSSDPWTHAICARVLCKVPFGETASREAVEEAFEAVDKLFTQLPKRTNPNNAAETWPHAHLFPIKQYFLMAVNLGTRDKAREILRLAMTKDEFALNDLVEIPAVYELLREMEAEAGPGNQVLAAEEIALVQSALPAALKQRKDEGQQEPLPGVEWPELLRRWSEAAWKVNEEDYAEVEIYNVNGEPEDPPQQPSDLLRPPISPERLAEIENELGPLPQDLKDMALVADGFLGAWHFAGSGFAGVEKMFLEHPSEYETYLGIEPPSQMTTETRTNPDGTTRTVTKHVVSIGLNDSSGVNWGPVYACEGAVENDNFRHLICPPETWKKMRTSGKMRKGGEVREGEYRVCHYANWTAGTDGSEWRSMRHWVASMTAELERELEGMEDVDAET